MKKYKFTQKTKEHFGLTLHQIEAVIDFGNVGKGEKGGFVEREENLSQGGNAWVSGNAQIYGNAWVSGDALVYGNARVYGNAQIYGDAQVYGDAWVYGDAQVYGKLKLTSGYFYHTKRKSETIEKIENDENYETLCQEPKIDLEKSESPVGKKVRIELIGGQIVEGVVVE